MLVAVSSPLTRLIPGLMIWTIVFFLIVFFVLRKYAFGAIQKLIDERREAIRRSVEAADEARDEAQRLLEEHKKLIAEARGHAEAIFGAAKDAGRLAQVHEALADFATAAAESPELRAVLRNPQLESSAKAAILADLAGDEEPLFTHFLQVVAEKGRAAELEEI